MKGFVYLLEISIALILMLVVMGTLSSFKTKENWERPDLISIGENMIRLLDEDDFLNILNNDTSKIQSLKPPNVDFGIKISGASKTNISIGCAQPTQYCDYIRNLTRNVYFNNRWVNFSVDQFTIDSSGIPSKYDAVVFVNYTGYTNQRDNITNYLNQGGVVIGVNRSYSNTDFYNIFGLSSVISGSGDFNFTDYNPSEDETEKYFIYLGFDINANNTKGSKRQGYWRIWENSREVNITSNTVDVQNLSVSETGLTNIPINGTFKIKKALTDTNFYTFRVNKIDWNNNLTVFQPLDVPFTFKNFSEANSVNGTYNIIALSNDQAEMTSNNNAVWISDFPWSDEYMLLVRNAIASRVKEWYVKSPNITKEYVTVSSFYPLCCDMPETAEMTIYLWYKI